MEKSSTLECEDIKTRLQNEDDDSIPLADDDGSVSVLDEENSSEMRVTKWRKGHESLDSIPSIISDSLPGCAGPSNLIGKNKMNCECFFATPFDLDLWVNLTSKRRQ